MLCVNLRFVEFIGSKHHYVCIAETGDSHLDLFTIRYNMEHIILYGSACTSGTDHKYLHATIKFHLIKNGRSKKILTKKIAVVCFYFLYNLLEFAFHFFKQVEVYPIFSTILQLFAQVMEYP